MKVQHFELPKFVHAVIDDPDGYKPGRYHFVLFLEQNRKVSRYLRRASSVRNKIVFYDTLYANGDRHWPEVTREDELRDSPDALPTIREKFRVMLWGHE